MARGPKGGRRVGESVLGMLRCAPPHGVSATNLAGLTGFRTRWVRACLRDLRRSGTVEFVRGQYWRLVGWGDRAPAGVLPHPSAVVSPTTPIGPTYMLDRLADLERRVAFLEGHCSISPGSMSR